MNWLRHELHLGALWIKKARGFALAFFDLTLLERRLFENFLVIVFVVIHLDFGG